MAMKIQATIKINTNQYVILLKGRERKKIQSTIVPTLLYGCETWGLTKTKAGYNLLKQNFLVFKDILVLTGLRTITFRKRDFQKPL
jgi:hypothetical protein